MTATTVTAPQIKRPGLLGLLAAVAAVAGLAACLSLLGLAGFTPTAEGKSERAVEKSPILTSL